jgi:hypothetical protein
MSIAPPPTWATDSGGAVSPTWKLAVPDPPDDDADALADEDGDAGWEATDGEVVGADDAVDDAEGDGDTAEPASGRATTSTAMASDATITPVRSPATVDRRGPTGARVAARPPEGGVGGPLLGCAVR